MGGCGLVYCISRITAFLQLSKTWGALLLLLFAPEVLLGTGDLQRHLHRAVLTISEPKCLLYTFTEVLNA